MIEAVAVLLWDQSKIAMVLEESGEALKYSLPTRKIKAKEDIFAVAGQLGKEVAGLQSRPVYYGIVENEGCRIFVMKGWAKVEDAVQGKGPQVWTGSIDYFMNCDETTDWSKMVLPLLNTYKHGWLIQGNEVYHRVAESIC